MKAEPLAFEEALEKEPERLRGEKEKIIEDKNYYSFNHQHFSYLSRGIYVEQLRLWMSLFAPERFLVIRGEDFFSNSNNTLRRVLDFLNLPTLELEIYSPLNSSSYPRMNALTRKRLVDYFAPHNLRLCEYLNWDLRWDI